MAYPLLHPSCPLPSVDRLSAEQFAIEYPAEGMHIEFKEGVSLDGIAETAVAFSNSDGGVILLGIADSGFVKGVELSEAKETQIHNRLAQVADLGIYKIHRLTVDGRMVVAIGVNRQQSGFAQLKDGRIKERRGASNHTLMGNQLADFIARRFVRAPETAPTRALFNDTDQDLGRRLAAAWGWSIVGDAPPLRQLLLDHGFLVAEGGVERPTVAGALFLLADPGAVLGKSYVEVFRYADDGIDYDRRVEFRGPLQDQVENAAEFVLDELGYHMTLVGVHRHELHRLPRVVVREAIANAVAHRNYAMISESTKIEMRPDRVVVRSPGALPEGVTLVNLPDKSVPRNVLTIRTLRFFGVAEDAGRGINLMQDRMALNLMEPPKFAADNWSVTVTLPLGSEAIPSERAWLEELVATDDGAAVPRYSVGDRQTTGLRMTPHEVQVMLLAGRGEDLTSSRIRDLLSVDARQAGALLQRLRDRGLLEQHGTDSGTSYGLHPGIDGPDGLRVQRRDFAAEVLDLAQTDRVTNAAVRTLTGLDRAAAVRLLNRLVAGGQLERRGTKRGAHYVLPSQSTSPNH